MSHSPTEEWVPRRWGQLSLLLVGALLALPFLFPLPLTPAEGVMTGAARGILNSGDITRLRHLGQPIHQYPLYPWMLAALRLDDAPAWMVRLPAVAGWLFLALLAGWGISKSSGVFGRFIATLVPLTCAAPLALGTTAVNDSWFAVFLFAAWLSWYQLGVVRQRWNAAWAGAAVLVGLAFFAGGLHAFLFFYLPLLLMRSPVKAREQLLGWGHLLALAVAVVLCGTWLTHSLRHAEVFTWSQLVETAVQPRQGGYAQRLWQFPLRAFAWGLPWSLFVWPAFCLAFRPVEPDPAQASFFRTVTGTLFLLCWLIPGVPLRSLLVLTGPLAVLAAMNLGILLRRHGGGVHRLLRVLSWVAYGAISLAVLGLLMLFAGWIEISWLTFYEVSFLAACAVVSGGLAVLLFRSHRRPAWLRILLLVALAVPLVRALSLPGEVLERGHPRRLAWSIDARLPGGTPLYTSADLSLTVIEHYITGPVLRLESGGEVPQPDPRVYLLTAEEPPVREDLQWQALGPPVALGGGAATIQRDWGAASGSLLTISLRRPQSRAEAELNGAQWLQLYEGRPRTLNAH